MHKEDKKISASEKIAGMYQLDYIDHKLLQIMLKYPGIKRRELSALLEISLGEITVRRNKPAFKQAIKEMQKSIYERIEQAQMEAIEIARKHLRSSDEHVSMRACELLLKPLLFNDFRNPIVIDEISHVVEIGEHGEILAKTHAGSAPKTKVIDILGDEKS